MNLKRVRKRDLCSLIRYLNFYHLNRDRIHYFSIRVKEDLVHDLAKIYEITEDETSVYFKATAVRLPDFRYRSTTSGSRPGPPSSCREAARSARGG